MLLAEGGLLGLVILALVLRSLIGCAHCLFNKVILIGRLGKNAEAKTTQSKKDYTVLNLATSESWKGDQGKYETHTEWLRVYAWGNLANFAKSPQKGQLISPIEI